jgi:hypothetical protein
MFQTKIVETIKTRNFCSIKFFRKSFPLLNNVEKYFRAGEGIDGNMMHALPCWIPKATNTISKYVIIIDFPLQQWLHECASVLRNTYLASFRTFGFNYYSSFRSKIVFQQWKLVQVRIQ